MPNIETPEEFAVIMDSLVVALDDVPNQYLTRQEKAKRITARDAAIRAESAELLRVCGEALNSANKQTQGVNAKVRTALAALKDAGMRV